MLVWWFIGSIGFLSTSIIYCENITSITSDDDAQPEDFHVNLMIANDEKEPTDSIKNDLPTNEDIIKEPNSIKTSASELLYCHECTNCDSPADVIISRCDAGVTMCYKMSKRISKTSLLIHRGCSTSKGHCTVPEDDQSNSFESVTCCRTPKCNQAVQVKLSLLLSSLGLLIIFIIFNDT
ncbi:unnamed protein product [Rotaria magnacalcarata]|uniref:Uncharacterized protein n=1 Tax=Rotaria magnacalcarata TaxID=392030 RepID=A0A816TU28_9BILA|nr:unnamed protein product [Rotaria magnacalcarata]